MTPGACELATVVAKSTVAAVARRLGCDESAVRAWVRERRKPSHDWRVKIASELGIAVDAWNAPAPPTSPAPASTASSSPAAGASPAPGDVPTVSAAEVFAHIVSRLRELDRQATEDKHTPVRDKAAIFSAMTAAAKAFARVTGEDGSITEAKILASPAMRRIRDVMLETLKPWPDAMRAVGEAIVRVSRTESTR